MYLQNADMPATTNATKGLNVIYDSPEVKSPIKSLTGQAANAGSFKNTAGNSGSIRQ